MKNIKIYGKIINNNTEAMTLYEEYTKCCSKVEELEQKVNENFRVYNKMEGKYSNGTFSTFSEQGMRGYGYKYANDFDKTNETKERAMYYQTHIAPLKSELEALRKKSWEIDENLCIALWGYGVEWYNTKLNLDKAEKELEKQKDYVEFLKNKLKNFAKPIDKFPKI